MEIQPLTRPAGRLLPTLGRPRAMTRCECSGVAFEEVARRMKAEGLSMEAAMRGLDVGQLCTACGPDLTSFLRARGAIE